MLRGSCLCGDVGYEISGPIEEIHHCRRFRSSGSKAHEILDSLPQHPEYPAGS